jgi:hypothetical protein
MRVEVHLQIAAFVMLLVRRRVRRLDQVLAALGAARVWLFDQS